MLDNIFIVVLNMSITASYAAIVIFLLRMLLKKAPKWISYAMWSVVLLRAVLPFSFSSVLSLFGRLGGDDAATANGMIRYIPESIGMSEVPTVNIGIPEVNNIVNESLPGATPYANVNPMQVIVFVAATIWLAGVAAMLVYSVISYAALKQRISTAVHIEDTVYESDRISTAFVCGFLKPRIYLPIGLPESSRSRNVRRSRERCSMYSASLRLTTNPCVSF